MTKLYRKILNIEFVYVLMLGFVLCLKIHLNIFVQTKKVACNACIYQPIVSNLKTHFFGSKSHLIDFEFQIPCTFYSPMITVSTPKGFKINSIKLLPSNKIGKFENFDKGCNERNWELDYTINKGLLNSEEKNFKNLSSDLNKIIDNGISCELKDKSEEELFSILTSLGFENWEIISQNSSKCLEVPEYEVRGNGAIKLMDNLSNGSYVLRFDLENPKIDEFEGNWNLSITSTKNNIPTIPFCLTSISQNSVSNTLGPLLSFLNLKNVKFNSYYVGSQLGKFSFTIKKPDFEKLSFVEDIKRPILEPLRIRLTFPLCKYEENCFGINTDKFGEDFCEIIGHKYHCYIEALKPNMILTIGILESINKDLKNIFPIKIVIKGLIIPQKFESNNLKLEVLINSVPSSRPIFLNLNETSIDMIKKKDSCIAEWLKFLLNKDNDKLYLNKQFQQNNSNKNLIYSPISVGTYKLPNTMDIQVKIRYRISNSDTYPILLQIGKIDDKISNRYDIKIKSLLEGVEFLVESLDKRIAYSKILLQPLIYDKSKFQEEVNIEFETKTNSIILRNIDPKYEFQCILLLNNNRLKSESEKQILNFKNRKEEWDIEIYSLLDLNGDKESVLITKKKLMGEIIDKKETQITEIAGPLIFINSNNDYFMMIYFYFSSYQYNKIMTISLIIPDTITEYISEELKIQVYSSKANLKNAKTNKNININKYIKEKKLILVLESNQGFSQGWWGLSIQITRPKISQSIENNNYVELNISSSISTLNNPYLTSLLFLGINKNYKGPYLMPTINKILESNKKNYFVELVSIQQNHTSYHPFPLLENQVVDLETNSPDYFATSLIYKEKFRFVYIIDEKSLNNKEINLKTRELNDLGSSKCQVFLLIGNNYFEEFKCKDDIIYKRVNKDEDDEDETFRISTDVKLITKIVRKLFNSAKNYVINSITLVVDQNDVEQLDKDIFQTKEIIPNERVNYNFIIKKYNQILTSKLNLDPNPSYYENFYQFKKALISNQYYNLYTIPSSIQVFKLCPPEIPLLSGEKLKNHPLIFRFKYFNDIIISYNYSVTPNIPGTCLKQKLLTSNSLHLGVGKALKLIAIQSILILILIIS